MCVVCSHTHEQFFPPPPQVILMYPPLHLIPSSVFYVFSFSLTSKPSPALLWLAARTAHHVVHGIILSDSSEQTAGLCIRFTRGRRGPTLKNMTLFFSSNRERCVWHGSPSVRRSLTLATIFCWQCFQNVFRHAFDVFYLSFILEIDWEPPPPPQNLVYLLHLPRQKLLKLPCCTPPSMGKNNSSHWRKCGAQWKWWFI